MSDAFFTVEYLTAGYGKATVLHNVSFTLSAGSVTLLTGRNGVGKSTLMKSLIGLVPTSKAMVRLENTTLITARKPGNPIEIARAGIGYVPEERRIFGALTVLENLEVGRQPRRDGAPHWTVEQLFEIFPNLAERRRNQGKAMSGGEQQMLTIARTLMGNPNLLLLDEPSEGIAPVIVEQMAATILKLKAEGLTVMISEQNLHFARAVADRAIIIEGGEVKFDGSFTQLEASPEIRDAYLAV